MQIFTNIPANVFTLYSILQPNLSFCDFTFRFIQFVNKGFFVFPSPPVLSDLLKSRSLLSEMPLTPQKSASQLRPTPDKPPTPNDTALFYPSAHFLTFTLTRSSTCSPAISSMSGSPSKFRSLERFTSASDSSYSSHKSGFPSPFVSSATIFTFPLS